MKRISYIAEIIKFRRASTEANFKKYEEVEKTSNDKAFLLEGLDPRYRFAKKEIVSHEHKLATRYTFKVERTGEAQEQHIVILTKRTEETCEGAIPKVHAHTFVNPILVHRQQPLEAAYRNLIGVPYDRLVL